MTTTDPQLPLGQEAKPEAPPEAQPEPAAENGAKEEATEDMSRIMGRPIHAPSAIEIIAQTPHVAALAEIMFRSRLAPFDTQKQGQDAIQIIMMKGLELSIPPLLAVQHIFIIKGRISMAAQLMRSLFLGRCPGGRLNITESDDTHCIMVALRPGQDPLRVTFDISEAKRAQLVKADSNWEKWPKDMCFERCTSRLARRYWPDILMGCGYTPDELREVAGADNGDNGPAKEALKDFLANQKPAHQPPPDPKETEAKNFFKAEADKLAVRDQKDFKLQPNDYRAILADAQRLSGKKDIKEVGEWMRDEGRLTVEVDGSDAPTGVKLERME